MESLGKASYRIPVLKFIDTPTHRDSPDSGCFVWAEAFRAPSGELAGPVLTYGAYQPLLPGAHPADVPTAAKHLTVILQDAPPEAAYQEFMDAHRDASKVVSAREYFQIRRNQDVMDRRKKEHQEK